MDKHSESTVCKKVFSSSKAVSADFSLEILHIEEKYSKLTKIQTSIVIQLLEGKF